MNNSRFNNRESMADVPPNNFRSFKISLSVTIIAFNRGSVLRIPVVCRDWNQTKIRFKWLDLKTILWRKLQWNILIFHIPRHTLRNCPTATASSSSILLPCVLPFELKLKTMLKYQYSPLFKNWKYYFLQMMIQNSNIVVYLELLSMAFLYRSNRIAALCSPSLSSSRSSVRL